MQAAVECLLDGGYAAATVGAIQERAELSRGALLHQYPNKAELLIDAVQHLTERQLEEAAATPSATPPNDDWLTPLWARFTTPLFNALLELWVAARTDEQLHAALLTHQRALHRSLRDLAVAHYHEPPPQFDTVFDMTLTYFRGLALTTILSTRHRDQLLSEWRRAVTTLLAAPTPPITDSTTSP